MIKTMISDRKRADIASQKLKVAETETAMVRAENVALMSQIRYLKELLKLKEQENCSV